MADPSITVLPPSPRPIRKPVIAAALSLILPGVGLIYVGAVLPALAFLAAWVVVKPLLAVLLGLGAIEVKPWWYADFSADFVLRAIAGTVSFIWARNTKSRPLPVVPPGVYGLSLLAAIAIKLLISTQLQKIVPIAELAADAYGFRAGEYVQARKVPPVPGLVGVYLYDSRDAGPSNPAAPTKRDAYVGKVGDVTENRFSIEGLDASLPSDDFLGEVLGVVLSKTDAGNVDWQRLGSSPAL